MNSLSPSPVGSRRRGFHSRLLRPGAWLALACVSAIWAHAAGPAASVPQAAAVNVPWVGDQASPGSFALATQAGAARLWIAVDDAPVVGIAARDLAADIARVAGVTPEVASWGGAKPSGDGPVVLIGTLGTHPAIEAIVAAGKLDVSALRGSWETFLIATVADPIPGVKQGLVIVGSDRRGTAFGVYELSQAIGVSPWHWWADVVPVKKAALHVAAGTQKFGPPSVQYRGIFINDEDWGLQPWAAQTFSPEEGGIGPKVYRKVFELLLRLKANTLWPAMHECTKPFNAFPENAKLADEYAIVMGSSHAEPMLRNNVGEWKAPKPDYSYVTNREGVRKYWEERVQTNGRFENIYTLGMRGIHDSGIQGAKTDDERIAVLHQVFADQRALLAQHVRPDVERLPQMFCAYKEVLDLYRKGLQVPDDVTIVWPDDNFGYIRNFASAGEQKRSGGFGVYYHISYLGRPLAYLWLNTTPPALIWEEMTKAYAHGARKIWIVNVGDIKPAEIGTEFFLQLAWDVERWGPECQEPFLREWAEREFGRTEADLIGAVLDQYFRVNFQRKPEHLQWWLPRTEPRVSALSDDERKARLGWFHVLAERVGELRSRIPGAAFEQLVAYPILGAKLANERIFYDELGMAEVSAAAQAELELSTAALGRLAEGKWKGFMTLEPADGQWSSMRIAKWASRGRAPERTSDEEKEYRAFAFEAERFAKRGTAASGAAWVTVPGLGRTGLGAVTVQPFTMASVALDRALAEAPRLEYALPDPLEGEFTLQAYLVPAHPLRGDSLRFAVSLDDGAPQLVELKFNDGSADWAQGVLNNTRVATTKLTVGPSGARVLNVYGLEPGVILDKLVLFRGELPPSYLGPRETFVEPRRN